jgi:trigger factor
MDVKSLFTPDLVRKLMQNSRPEAEERLRRSFALTALAEAEGIKVEDAAVDAKIKEVKKELAAEAQGKIDPERLRQAVMDDLMQDQLMGWLEENSTLTEKAAAEEEAPAAKKKAASKSKPNAKAKSEAKAESKADAED